MEKPADGEDPSDLKITGFKYEKQPRDPIQKDWQTLPLNKSAADTPSVAKKQMAAFAVEKPLPPGRYAYKFIVDGTEYLQSDQQVTSDDDGEFKMFTVAITTCFGLGFDVGV